MNLQKEEKKFWQKHFRINKLDNVICLVKISTNRQHCV